jgi:hypothetical protein
MKVRGFKFSSSDFVNWSAPGSFLLLARPRFSMRDLAGVNVMKYQASGDKTQEYSGEVLDKFVLQIEIPTKLAKLDDTGSCGKLASLLLTSSLTFYPNRQGAN